MAVTKLVVLNPADKTRHYTVAIGEGSPAEEDVLVTDTKNFPAGSQYTDKSGKKFYVRIAEEAAVADWQAIG